MTSTDNTVTYDHPDATPPETSITASPANPSASSQATFSFSGTDDIAVAGFECSLEGAAFTDCSSPPVRQLPDDRGI